MCSFSLTRTIKYNIRKYLTLKYHFPSICSFNITYRGHQSCEFAAAVSGNEFEPLAYVGNILIQNGRFYLNYFRFGYYLKYCSLELMRNLIIG